MCGLFFCIDTSGSLVLRNTMPDDYDVSSERPGRMWCTPHLPSPLKRTYIYSYKLSACRAESSNNVRWSLGDQNLTSAGWSQILFSKFDISRLKSNFLVKSWLQPADVDFSHISRPWPCLMSKRSKKKEVWGEIPYVLWHDESGEMWIRG